MSNWRDKVKAARLPETTVQLVLRGDLAAEHEKLSRELTEVRERKTGSLAGSGAGPIEEALQALEEAMRDSILEVRLRALPREKRSGDSRPSWRELKELHPPRKDDAGATLIEDRIAGGVNVDAIAEPLARVSVIEPDDITDADWSELMAKLTDHQFDELVNAAWGLNQRSVDIPFSSAGSQTSRTSAGS